MLREADDLGAGAQSNGPMTEETNDENERNTTSEICRCCSRALSRPTEPGTALTHRVSSPGD